jgi:hypothetical protein
MDFATGKLIFKHHFVLSRKLRMKLLLCLYPRSDHHQGADSVVLKKN